MTDNDPSPTIEDNLDDMMILGYAFNAPDNRLTFRESSLTPDTLRAMLDGGHLLREAAPKARVTFGTLSEEIYGASFALYVKLKPSDKFVFLVAQERGPDPGLRWGLLPAGNHLRNVPEEGWFVSPVAALRTWLEHARTHVLLEQDRLLSLKRGIQDLMEGIGPIQAAWFEPVTTPTLPNTQETP